MDITVFVLTAEDHFRCYALCISSLFVTDTHQVLQMSDLSLKLAEALGIAQELYPLTKPNLLCCLLKMLLSSWSAFFPFLGPGPTSSHAQLPGMPFLKDSIPYGRSAFMGRSISDAPVEQMLHVNHAGD